jgi:hypothetical protein
MLTKETTYQKIIRKTGRKPIECKCHLCRMQCKTPCLGTPEDIEKLIDTGYGNKLALTEWAVGLVMGIISYSIPMIQAIQTEKGCIFLENGLCSIHEKGLKQTEGKLSHHSTRLDNFKFSKSISWNVAKEWIDQKNIEIIKRVLEKFINNTTN